MDSMLASRITGGNTAYKRAESDFYPTPPAATIALLDFLALPKGALIWEPACGQNHMVDTIRSYGYKVIGTDIQSGTNFLTSEMPDGVDWIITNPPFSLSEKFIRRAMSTGNHLPYCLRLNTGMQDVGLSCSGRSARLTYCRLPGDQILCSGNEAVADH